MHALERFRELNSNLRAQIVTGLSIAIGLGLLGLWLTILPGQIQKATLSTNSDTVESPFSILQTLRGGSAMIYQNFQSALESTKRELGTPKSVTITPNNP